MRGAKKDIKKSILVRVRTLYLLMFIAGMAIAGKILYIQYGPDGDELREKGEKIVYERVKIEADRGDILSHDGRILATSIPMYEIRMDFAANGITDTVFRKNVDSLAYSLAGLFQDKSAAAYRDRLVSMYGDKSKNRYALISPRRINHIELQDVKKFPLFRLGANRGGFIAVQVNRRILPHGAMASRTIGMTNEAGVKVGIEGAFDTILKGVEGNVLMQRISGSFRIPVPDELSVDPIDGIDVVTTIDADIQDVAESALRRQLVDFDADWGTAILMEVATGEIRAMSNLTKTRDGRVVEDFNHAIGQNLEPGSTIKLASLLALLDDAGADIGEMIDTEHGRALVGRAVVVDTHDYGELTLAGAFEHSSNVVFAKIVNKYYAADPKRFVDQLRKMGVDKPLNLQIPGGQDPVVRSPGDRWWDGMTLTMMSYGYALRLTPLKTLTLYNAVANDGKLINPILVKELRQYGQTLRTYKAETVVQKIASDKTIRTVRETMTGVVDNGTAGVLKNPSYKVAAKTGTAQVAMGRSGYTDAAGGRHYLGSMAGFFPADNPKYTCLVLIKTYNGPGRRNTYYGASLAGPVFRAIADRVYAKNVSWQDAVSKGAAKADGHPYVKTGNMDEVRTVSRRFDVPYDNVRGAEWITANTADTTGKILYAAVRPEYGVVPTVTGMGLKDAVYLIEKEGFVVSFTGRGRVTAQSVAGGRREARGTVVVLTLGN